MMCAKNAIKSACLVVFWVQISKHFLIFVKIFRKFRNLENSCCISPNLMYNVVLNLINDRIAEGAAKILRKTLFGQI